MRKILLILIIVLLLALGITTAVNGIEIGSLKIYSIKGIEEKSEELDAKIQEINTLIDSQYPSKVDDLTRASKEMQSKKSEYVQEINQIKGEDLESTLLIKNFDIERIWSVVGNHAIDAGVNITVSISKKSTTGARNIHFDVKGTYVAQTNFLYALANDDEFGYKIYNYKLVPFKDNILEATFALKEIIITKSLNDDINGLEYVDPIIQDRIFTQEDKVNGDATSEAAKDEKATSPQSKVNQNIIGSDSESSTTSTEQSSTTNDNVEQSAEEPTGNET